MTEKQTPASGRRKKRKKMRGKTKSPWTRRLAAPICQGWEGPSSRSSGTVSINPGDNSCRAGGGIVEGTPPSLLTPTTQASQDGRSTVSACISCCRGHQANGIAVLASDRFSGTTGHRYAGLLPQRAGRQATRREVVYRYART